MTLEPYRDLAIHCDHIALGQLDFAASLLSSSAALIRATSSRATPPRIRWGTKTTAHVDLIIQEDTELEYVAPGGMRLRVTVAATEGLGVARSGEMEGRRAMALAIIDRLDQILKATMRDGRQRTDLVEHAKAISTVLQSQEESKNTPPFVSLATPWSPMHAHRFPTDSVLYRDDGSDSLQPSHLEQTLWATPPCLHVAIRSVSNPSALIVDIKPVEGTALPDGADEVDVLEAPPELRRRDPMEALRASRRLAAWKAYRP